MRRYPSTAMSQTNHIPPIGFGLWKIAPKHCSNAVYEAIKLGYRHFDSACDYGNEREVGVGIARAINEKLCSRDELWITSKLWNTYHDPAHVELALQKTLSDLRLDYLDLYLIHFPIALAYVPFEQRYPPEWFYNPEAPQPSMKPAKVPLHKTWQAMESLLKKGLVKNIGACNYNSGLLHDLMNYADIQPTMLQIESHPFLTQEPLIRLCRHYHIDVTAFSPLGALSYLELDMAKVHESALGQPCVIAAATRLNKTPAQIILRWGVQRGTAIIPKTIKPQRMSENLALFDFKLTTEEMASISSLNRNRRFNDPGVFCEAAFNSFYPIYD